MFKILKYMKSHWKAVAVIVVLLFVQAFCELALPDYTSSLIDTGIMNNGIEYGVPVTISAEDYQKIALFMTEDEKTAWTDAYQLRDDGLYALKDTSSAAMKKDADIFVKPIAIVYMMSQMDASQMQAQMMSDTNAITSMSDVRAMIEEQLSTLGDSMLSSYAVAYVKSAYTAQGVDLNAMQTNYLWTQGAKMLMFALLMAAVAVAISFFSSRVGAGIGCELREKVFNRVVSFSNAEMGHFSTASLITRSTNDIQQVQMVSTMLLRMIFYSPILAIGGIIMVLRVGAGMEWIIVMAVLLVMSVVLVLVSITMPKFKLMQTLVDKVNLISREILTGLSVIRAFGREDLEEKRFDDANKDLTKTMLFTNRMMNFMMPAMMLIMNCVSILIIWVSANRIDAGQLQVGQMMAFINYTMIIVMSFLMLTMVSIMLPRAAVAAGRIDEVIGSEPTIKDPKAPKKLQACKGVVRFDHVSFKYPGAEDNVLSDIDFTALPGQTTAIIGSTGSGKSTLLHLIPRFYDVTEGKITLDGVDIRDMTQHDLRKNIGFVPQKGVLFSGTIASNLRFGDENASDAAVREAAEIAQATEFIDEKPEKYDAPIAQGGTNVSGGQKQRLSIARAIAMDPKVYIFDDSFSALDFKTDVTLRRALAPKTKDATVLIVAQRISTVLHADQILVLEDGKLVGKGTHSQLMDTCDVYRQIAVSQLSEKELAAGYTGKEATIQ